ncbi:MAG: hypothetical protein M0Z67_09200 [Nitrospiraceae bacterium]|nr:hypothetical protein [Nitrospiraceae bacterium]
MKKNFAFMLCLTAAVTICGLLSETYAIPLSFDKILIKPIIEGKEVAGIRLGDNEATLEGVIGNLPLNAEIHSESEKTLSYGNMTDEGGIGINVFIKNGVVIGVEVISRPILSRGHLYEGKTQRGFSFGDSIARINALYGKAYKIFGNKMFWYKKKRRNHFRMRRLG